MSLKTFKPGKDWTLFLDRDGVINRRIVGGYITVWDEFEFLPGTFDALKEFSSRFGRIIVVSNQQGVAKGLMTNADVEMIHSSMIRQIEGAGGRIDLVLYAPHLASEGSEMRKPSIGMALRAKEMFPEISFEKSVMAGDSLSDLEFGRNAGMVTVFICPDKTLADKYGDLVDFQYPDLVTFSRNL
jgi:histidinol-phosphate phosphatase family protein